jgi:penicillin-binding protein 1A
MYLNKFDFLNNAVALKPLRTPIWLRTLGTENRRSRTLVGMCKNPSLFNPVRFNERSRGRRNVVLDQMRRPITLPKKSATRCKSCPLR